jgi:hypothetical protein
MTLNLTLTVLLIQFYLLMYLNCSSQDNYVLERIDYRIYFEFKMRHLIVPIT